MAAYYSSQPPSFQDPSYSYYPPPPGAGPPPPPPPSAPLPPPYPHAYPPLPSSAAQTYSIHDELRTLFIAGLPDDVKPREIYNLFREFPGYQSCQLKSSSQAFAFAVFSDQQSAVAAMHALNPYPALNKLIDVVRKNPGDPAPLSKWNSGLMFDLEKELTLHIDLARSNSRSKRFRTDDARDLDKRFRGSSGFSEGVHGSGSGSNMHMPGMANSAYDMYPSTRSHGISEGPGVQDPDHNRLMNTTPCATLFVADLSPTCTEQELTQVFSRCPGFLKLKMQNKHGMPVAFVDFKDVTYSTLALNHLQGTTHYSSQGEGLRLEYAKTRMGQRKREK